MCCFKLIDAVLKSGFQVEGMQRGITLDKLKIVLESLKTWNFVLLSL